ncbi:MAG: sodium:alanine symporter family protein [Gammaproteobacteria bacterium]|nr:sodium:alanine symporter family protein [Gammaproteobacteria bacterium]
MGFIEQLTQWTGNAAASLSHNPVTLAIIVGTGLYLTIRLGLVQFMGFRHALRVIRGRYSKSTDQGQVNHFQALSTALSATVGTGNIAGVATAIALGGPGALFWMWVTASVGMATKFTESTLAIKFREVDANGDIAGGPMYTLLNGLKMKRAAWIYALFALFTAMVLGNMVQANSVVDGLAFIWPELKPYNWLVGICLAIPVGLVIVGGVRRIAKVATAIVPFMALLYVGSGLIVLFIFHEQIPAAIATIFNQALNIWAFGGAAVGSAIQWGVIRGLFSNEAGLGSSAMAHAAARTNEPVREGLVAMMEPFVDTLVICTITGLTIVVTGAYLETDGDASSSVTALAFSGGLGRAGGWVIGISVCLFAFSTMLSWSYYGDRSAEFMFGEQAIMPYRVLFTLLVVVGASVPLPLVWNLADIATVLMAIPNLFALILLAALVKKLKNDYFNRYKNS